MAAPTGYVEKGGTGKVYVDPGSGVSSQAFPAAGLTRMGKWVPLAVDDFGSIILSPDDTQAGIPHYEQAQETTTPGAEQTLLTGTVPAGTARLLDQVLVVTRVTGSFVVTLNGNVIGSGRTGPGCNGIMPYRPSRPLSAGDQYAVLFMSRLNSSPQGVECYLQATDVPHA